MGNYKYRKPSKNKGHHDSIASIYLRSIETGLLSDESLLNFEPEQGTSTSLVLFKKKQPKLTIIKKWSGMSRNPLRNNKEKELIRLAQIRSGSIKMNEQMLLLAANNGNLTTVRRLINSWVNPSCRDEHNRTPLHFAASKGYTAIIETLIEAGADATLMDKNGNSPLDLAAISNHLEAVIRLTNAGAKIHDDEALSNGRIRIKQVTSPLRMIRTRLAAYKSTNLPISESLITAMNQIIGILRKHIIPSNNTSNDSNLDDIESLCDNLQKGLNIKDEQSSLTTTATVGQQSGPQVDDALDQINSLMQKLDIV